MIECEKCKKTYPKDLRLQNCPACGHKLIALKKTVEEKGLSNELEISINSPLNNLASGEQIAKMHQFIWLQKMNYDTKIIPVICPICNKKDCGTMLYAHESKGEVGPFVCKHFPDKRWSIKIDPFQGIVRRIYDIPRVII